MQNVQKRKLNNLTGNMCANLKEDMGLLTICWLQTLSIKNDFLAFCVKVVKADSSRFYRI